MQVSSAMEASTSGLAAPTEVLNAEVTNATAATPQQPVRSAVTKENEHSMFSGSNDDTENHTVTTPGDIFSPRSAAAMALSAISQQNSLPMNLSMTTSMMATASAAAASASGVFVSRETSCSNSESASANSSTSSIRKATGTVSPTDYDYSSFIKKTSATKATKVTKKAADAKAQASTTPRSVPNPLAQQQHLKQHQHPHQMQNQNPNQLHPPPPHYANPMGPHGPQHFPPPPPPHHMQLHPHHMQHHPHHAPFMGPPPPPAGPGAGPGAGSVHGKGGNGNASPWGNRMPMPPMPYGMHPHQQHSGAPHMQYHPNMSMQQQQHLQQAQQHQQQLNQQQQPPPPYSGKGTTRPAPHSMVTPTPKKARMGDNNIAIYTDPSTMSGGAMSSANNSVTNSVTKNGDAAYSRKNKSLGVLARTFCSKYQYAPLGTEIIIDALAIQLGVERRRIYDVVNIFESINLVIKKGKNTYAWMGKAHMPAMFSLLQHEAVFDYPDDAVQTGIVSQRPTTEDITAHQAAFRDPKKDKSLTRLSQQFLQLFLIGHETVSLPDASDMIHGKPDMEDAKAAARSLKTKIRRLYDIANVFMAVGFLRKMDDSKVTLSAAAAAAAAPQRRPCFSWTFDLTPQQINSGYEKLSKHQKTGRTPFTLKDMMTLNKRTTRPFGGGAARAMASARSMASGVSQSAPSKQKQPPQQQQLLPTPHFSTPRMPPPGSQEHQQYHQALMMSDSKMAAGANTFMANIHQTGGAVLSSEKNKSNGPRRVSLNEQCNI